MEAMSAATYILDRVSVLAEDNGMVAVSKVIVALGSDCGLSDWYLKRAFDILKMDYPLVGAAAIKISGNRDMEDAGGIVILGVEGTD